MLETVKPLPARSILVVEDNHIQALQLQRLLEKASYTVSVAHSAEEALNRLDHEHIDLVVSDILLPQMDGFTLCEHIRTHLHLTTLPILLLTSLTEPKEVIRSLECGANGFMSKPYQDTNLLDHIKDLLATAQSIAKEDNSSALKLIFKNKEHAITANKQQMSTYEAVLQKNQELLTVQQQLQTLNDSLESKVLARTVELKKEIEERKLAQQHLSNHYELSNILIESINLVDIEQQAFKILRALSDCEFCSLWYEAQKSTVLHHVFTWATDQIDITIFKEFCKNTSIKRDSPTLGKVWSTAKPEQREINQELLAIPKVKLAYDAGIRFWLGVPIVVRGVCVGAMEFFWSKPHRLNEQTLTALQLYAVQLGEFITKQKLQQRFYQSKKMESIGQLTGGVAHDFNNLLMIMQGNLELLLTQPNLTEQAQKYITTALAAIDRGTEFNKRLLAFARRQMLQPTVLNISDAVIGTTKLLKPLLGETIFINTLFPEELYPIYVDPAQLENAIVNLAVNARDAMYGKGKLTFEAKNIEIKDQAIAYKYEIIPGDFVQISVTDTGVGIAPELLEKVFEPFFTTKEVGAGTGLGLSMVYGFVKQSKGFVTIYSEIGQGTTINLYLPKAGHEANAQQPMKANKAAGGIETVLVVEDEAPLRLLVVEYLAKLGYQVLPAEQAQEALEILKNPHIKIDLLFTDVVTPGKLSGLEFAQVAVLLCPHLKVLFTSGYPKSALQDKLGKEIPREHFLAKPYKMNELGLRIRQILEACPPDASS